jgi:hypothetical protein
MKVEDIKTVCAGIRDASHQLQFPEAENIRKAQSLLLVCADVIEFGARGAIAIDKDPGQLPRQVTNLAEALLMLKLVIEND